MVVVVEVLHQLGGRHHPPGVVHQVAQTAVFERGERHRRAVHRDPHLPRVERDGADREHRGGAAGCAAQQGTDAREQLLHGEGLRQIVVGAGVDPLDALGPGAARGQDQHREITACRAPLPEHREPVHSRQAEVEHGGVVVLSVALEPGCLAVAREVDRIARALEGRTHAAGDPRVILDEQDPHRYSTSRFRTRAVAASTCTSTRRPAGPITLNS